MFSQKLRQYMSLIILFFIFMPFTAKAAAETPARIFTGIESSDAILKNLDYEDVKNSDSWAKSAIWETGALELLKGYGNRIFGLRDRLSVEQAIAIAYNMAGREAEAQLAAEALDLAREDKKNYAPDMWSDGYIQLALNDGIITQEEYDDAFAADQRSLGSGDFRRQSPVTREDFAYYIARVLGLTPVNEQTHLFNSYNDWHRANPHRIPYIEALLQNKVMSGDNNGRFLPKDTVTREMAAQIIKNAEPLIFPGLGMEKSKGTIESIKSFTDKADGKNTEIKLINVRKSNGTLDQFRFIYPLDSGSLNEISGNINTEKTGTIVNETDVLKDETALKEGQEITYIMQNGRVLYVTVMNSTKTTVHKLVRILSVDEPAGRIQTEIIMDVPFSDVRMIDESSLNSIKTGGREEILSVSRDALIYIDFVKKSLKDIEPQSLMLLTMENNLVTAMEKVNLELLQESGIISGILEENNPALGYVTLYFYDGSGTLLDKGKSLSSYRTFSYINIDNVEVYKNGSPASIDDINPGDSVFLKLDEKGNITVISGTDNFYPVYGKVRIKGSNTLQIQKGDGTYQVISISQNTPVFKDRKRVSADDIKEGDDIRILLQTSGNQVIVGEVTISTQNPVISGVYKAQLNYYDEAGNSLVVSGMKYFKDGLWWQADVKGITKLDIKKDYKPEIPKDANGTVYFATGKNLLGNDVVIRATVVNDSINTGLISDTIAESLPGRGIITLLNESKPVSYGENTLIVKGGKLLEPNQVRSQDEAHFACSSSSDGSIRADVLWIREPAEDTGLALLRGRISGIDKINSVTLESFSQFNMPDWEFVNVQKTLTIDPMVTRLFDDGGRTDLAEFDDEGENSYKNRTIYVLAREGKAIQISTAPYGDVVYRGRISELEGERKDSFGHIITQAQAVVISEVKLFNRETWLWDNKQETRFGLPENAVIIKNGKITDRSALEKGDRITVISSVSGVDAFVVMAESY
jgi:hypothetical protein